MAVNAESKSIFKMVDIVRRFSMMENIVANAAQHHEYAFLALVEIDQRSRKAKFLNKCFRFLLRNSSEGIRELISPPCRMSDNLLHGTIEEIIKRTVIGECVLDLGCHQPDLGAIVVCIHVMEDHEILVDAC